MIGDVSRLIEATNIMTSSYANMDSSLTNQNIRKMTRQEIEDRKNFLASVILDRDAKLKHYDYVGVKISEGRANTEEYQDVIALKSQWANDKNQAIEEISYLDSLTPEDDLIPHGDESFYKELEF